MLRKAGWGKKRQYLLKTAVSSHPRKLKLKQTEMLRLHLHNLVMKIEPFKNNPVDKIDPITHT